MTHRPPYIKGILRIYTLLVSFGASGLGSAPAPPCGASGQLDHARSPPARAPGQARARPAVPGARREGAVALAPTERPASTLGHERAPPHARSLPLWPQGQAPLPTGNTRRVGAGRGAETATPWPPRPRRDPRTPGGRDIRRLAKGRDAEQRAPGPGQGDATSNPPCGDTPHTPDAPSPVPAPTPALAAHLDPRQGWARGTPGGGRRPLDEAQAESRAQRPGQADPTKGPPPARTGRATGSPHRSPRG
jgi:hypothetical protein